MRVCLDGLPELMSGLVKRDTEFNLMQFLEAQNKEDRRYKILKMDRRLGLDIPEWKNCLEFGGFTIQVLC